MNNIFNPSEITNQIRENFLPVSKDVTVTVLDKRNRPLKIENINQAGLFNEDDKKDIIVKNVKSFLTDGQKLLLGDENFTRGFAVFTKSRIIVRFNEQVNNIPVFGSRTRVEYSRKEKALKKVTRRLYWDQNDLNAGDFSVTTPKLGLSECVSKYIQDTYGAAHDTKESFSELVYCYDESSDNFPLSWHFHLVDKGKNDDVIVDAETGKVLRKGRAVVNVDYNVKAMAIGSWWKIMDGYPDQTDDVTDTVVDFLDFRLTRTDETPPPPNYEIANSYQQWWAYFTPIPSQNVTLASQLTGPQVIVSKYQGNNYLELQYYNPLEGDEENEFAIDDPTSHKMETSVFVHMTEMANWFNNTFDCQWENGAQMTGLANYNSPSGAEEGPNGWIKIQAEAHHPNTVYHEYSHKIIDFLFGYWIDSYCIQTPSFHEAEAMDEGFADLFSCFYRGHSKQYVYGDPLPPPRNLDNNYRYEEHYNFTTNPDQTKYGPCYGSDPIIYNWEPHLGGQIIAGAIWALHDRRFTNSDIGELFWEALNMFEEEEQDNRTFEKFAWCFSDVASEWSSAQKRAIHTAFNSIHGIEVPWQITPELGSVSFSIKYGNEIVLWIDTNDNFIIKNKIIENDTGSPSSGDFIFKYDGAVAAWIDQTDHNLHLTGMVLPGETDFSSGTLQNTFVFKNNGTAVAYIRFGIGSKYDLHVKEYFVTKTAAP